MSVVTIVSDQHSEVLGLAVHVNGEEAGRVKRAERKSNGWAYRMTMTGVYFSGCAKTRAAAVAAIAQIAKNCSETPRARR